MYYPCTQTAKGARLIILNTQQYSHFSPKKNAHKIQLQTNIQQQYLPPQIFHTKKNHKPYNKYVQKYKQTHTHRTQYICQYIANIFARQILPIRDDFNAKHQLWNNISRNTNGVIIKNHAKAENYQILQSHSYTYKQPNCNPSNTDIFLTNALYTHNQINRRIFFQPYLGHSNNNSKLKHEAK